MVNKPLDYDGGIREFKIQIQASDHGSPISLSSTTTMTIKVKDADDQNPVFSQDVYRASVSESATITVSSCILIAILFNCITPGSFLCCCCFMKKNYYWHDVSSAIEKERERERERD